MNRRSSGNIPSLQNCALDQWCKMACRQNERKMQSFHELQHIHKRLHQVAQEIEWYGNVSNSDIMIATMEHFNDLWKALSDKLNEVNKIMENMHTAQNDDRFFSQRC